FSWLASCAVLFVMILVAVGLFLGNLLGGKLSDAISPAKAMITCFFGLAVCLVLVYVVSPVEWAAYPMAFLTGLIAFTMGPAFQVLLIRTAHGAENLAAAGGQASFNIGNMMGAFLGGVPITLGFAYNTPVLIGALLALIAMLITFVFYRQIVLKKYR